MAEYKIDFKEKINASAQVGDVVYSITPPIDIIQEADLVGVIINITSVTITVNDSGIKEPLANDFIAFRKPAYNNYTNTSSLKGYFAEVEFSNDATTKKELFVVGSEVTESSK